MSDLTYPDAVADVDQRLATATDDENVELDIDPATIDERIGTYVEKRVPPSEATQYVAKEILDEAGVDQASGSGGSRAGTAPAAGAPTVTVDEITATGEWVSFTGTVVDLFDPSTDSILQQGKLADDTGTIRFTIWEDSGVTTNFELGECYTLSPTVTTEFGGNFELKPTADTDITHRTGEEALGIDPDTYTEEVTGTIVGFRDEMGLIKRCPNEGCGRVLADPPQCPDCGAVDPAQDLRTKAVLDNGEDTWLIFLDEANTNYLTDVDLAEAIAYTEQNGPNAAGWMIRDTCHGETVTVAGRDRGDTFNVTEVTTKPSPGIGVVEDVQEELRDIRPS